MYCHTEITIGFDGMEFLYGLMELISKKTKKTTKKNKQTKKKKQPDTHKHMPYDIQRHEVTQMKNE